MSIFTTLSSVGVSNPLACNMLANTTMAQLSFTGAPAGADVTIQVTMDNVQQYPTPTWTNVSTTHYSTAFAIDGATITILSPIGGLRLSSTAGTYTASAFVTLKMMQSRGSGV